MPSRRVLLWACVLLAGASAGCYRAMPLSPAAVEQALAPPRLDAIRVQAQALQHPILRPIAFDERDGLSPDEAAVLAVLANPSLRAVRDQRGIAAAQVIQAGILPNPVFTYDIERPHTEPGEVPGFNRGIEWEVTSLIALGAKIAAANSQARSVDLDVAWQEWQAAESAKTAVYTRLAQEAQLEKARAIDEHLRQHAALIEKAVEARQATVVELASAEAARQEARAAVLGLERGVARQSLALNRLLGLPAEAEVTLQKDIAWPTAAAVPPREELLKGLEERRLDLVALRRGYESQESTVLAAMLSQFPKVTLGHHRGRDFGNFGFRGPSVSAEIPVFDHNQGAIAVEKANRQKLFDEYMSRVFEARSEIAALCGEIDSVTAEVAAAEAAVPALERLVATYEQAVAGGQVPIPALYTARGDLARKQLDALKLKQELAEMIIELETLAGRYLPASPPPAAGGPAQQKEALP